MNAKMLLTLAALLSLLWANTSESQTSTVPWSVSDMGYDVVSSRTTTIRCLVGQGFVGTMRGPHATLEAGFLTDTLFRTAVTSVARPPELPGELSVLQNFPNPFNPSTTIRYGLPSRSNVILAIFNTLGQHVATLSQGEQDAGYHEIRFDGSSLPSGVYFYHIQIRLADSAPGRDARDGAVSNSETKRFLLLK